MEADQDYDDTTSTGIDAPGNVSNSNEDGIDDTNDNDFMTSTVQDDDVLSEESSSNNGIDATGDETVRQDSPEVVEDYNEPLNPNEVSNIDKSTNFPQQNVEASDLESNVAETNTYPANNTPAELDTDIMEDEGINSKTFENPNFVNTLD